MAKQSGVVLAAADPSSLPAPAACPPPLHTYRYARSNLASAIMGVPAMSDVMTVELNLRS